MSIPKSSANKTVRKSIQEGQTPIKSLAKTGKKPLQTTVIQLNLKRAVVAKPDSPTLPIKPKSKYKPTTQPKIKTKRDSLARPDSERSDRKADDEKRAQEEALARAERNKQPSVLRSEKQANSSKQNQSTNKNNDVILKIDDKYNKDNDKEIDNSSNESKNDEDSDDENEESQIYEVAAKTFAAKSHLYIRTYWDPENPAISELGDAVILAKKIKKQDKKTNSKEANIKRDKLKEKRNIANHEKIYIYVYGNGTEITDFRCKISLSPAERITFAEFFKKQEKGHTGLIARDELNDFKITDFINLVIIKAQDNESFWVQVYLGIIMFLVFGSATVCSLADLLPLWMNIVLGLIGAGSVTFSGAKFGKVLYDRGWWDSMKACCCCSCNCSCSNCCKKSNKVNVAPTLSPQKTITPTPETAADAPSTNVERTQSSSIEPVVKGKPKSQAENLAVAPSDSIVRTQSSSSANIKAVKSNSNDVAIDISAESVKTLFGGLHMPGQMVDTENASQALVFSVLGKVMTKNAPLTQSMLNQNPEGRPENTMRPSSSQSSSLEASTTIASPKALVSPSSVKSPLNSPVSAKSTSNVPVNRTATTNTPSMSTVPVNIPANTPNGGAANTPNGGTATTVNGVRASRTHSDSDNKSNATPAKKAVNKNNIQRPNNDARNVHSGMKSKGNSKK